MRRLVKWPMTAAWFAMGVLVTAGFFVNRVNDQDRCEAGNEFRRHDLPAAFDAYSDFLGDELGATEGQIDDAKDRFAVVMDDLFPARECHLLW